MNEHELQALPAQVDQALAAADPDADTDSTSAPDTETLWRRLGEAIEAWPDDARLRRLRIRLAEAAHAHTTRIADLAVLCTLLPEDREARLDLALLQCRWAFLMVDDDTDDTDEEGEDVTDEDDLGDSGDISDTGASDDTGALPSAQALLEHEARGWLTDLVQAQRHDADFCVKLLTRWSEAGIHAPWQKLQLVLLAGAAHPEDTRLARLLGEAWESLAGEPPAMMDSEGPLPMGFAVDVFGALWDPLLIERALLSHEQGLARHPGDSDLLARCARLHQAMSDFPTAATWFDAAADALERSTGSTDDDEERAEGERQSAELRALADQCRGGRTALTQASFDAIDDAMPQLQQPVTLPDDASDDVKEWLRSWQASSQERMGRLSAELELLREQQAGVRNAPDDEQLSELQQLAGSVAGRILASLPLEPMDMRAITPDEFERDWPGLLQAPSSLLHGLGWQALGWIEWPMFRQLLGHQSVSSAWVDPACGSVALLSPARGTVLVDLETTLSDGRHLVTSLSRGNNFLTGGPQVDTLFVEPTLPLDEAAALHQARLAWLLARSPGVSAHPPASLDDVMAQQEQGRQAKLHFRLTQGVTRFEALGVPNDYPEVFGPLLQAELGEGLTALRAGLRR